MVQEVRGGDQVVWDYSWLRIEIWEGCGSPADQWFRWGSLLWLIWGTLVSEDRRMYTSPPSAFLGYFSHSEDKRLLFCGLFRCILSIVIFFFLNSYEQSSLSSAQCCPLFISCAPWPWRAKGNLTGNVVAPTCPHNTNGSGNPSCLCGLTRLPMPPPNVKNPSARIHVRRVFSWIPLSVASPAPSCGSLWPLPWPPSSPPAWPPPDGQTQKHRNRQTN